MSNVEPEKQIFLDALDRESPEEIREFVNRACGNDLALKNRVETLLRAHCDAGNFLGRRSAETETINARPVQPIGSAVGPYKLREKIGEGGMGEVYVAEQTEPVRRKVALKVIKPGMASKDVVARFEAERQALAMMDHPNIASVLDGGATEAGQPFFVMELVRGVPITEYCDRERLSTTERLQLFIKVCRAVQHAHQKGIIHRDIKPSNVLVPEIDGEAVPKVIDFGVAKAVSQKLTDQTVYTHFEQVVGTPLYMSPEQAGTGVVDIDTRSDVYSLGVLLFELLTGNTPFDRETLKQSGFDEFRRMLREEEPRRPSQAISTLNAEAMSTISDRRACDPRRLMQTVRGELDWIVMKTLEKDRTRRYETANGLVRDIERYLNSEPVEACPPSATYRLKKFAKRNRRPLITASLITAFLVVSLSLLGIFKWQQIRQRRQVVTDVQQSLHAARDAITDNDFELATQQVAEARGRLANADESMDELESATEELAVEINSRREQSEQYERFRELCGDSWALAEWHTKKREQSAKDALAIYGVLNDKQWLEKLDHNYLTASQRAEVRETAYETLLLLAMKVHDQKTRNDESVSDALHFLRLAETFHEPTWSFYLIRKDCYEHLGEHAKAQRDVQRSEEIAATTVFDHWLSGQVVSTRDKNWTAALSHYEKALMLQPNSFRSLFSLAYSLDKLGRKMEALQAYRGCLALRPDHDWVLINLIVLHTDLEQYEQALQVANRAIDVRPLKAKVWQMRGNVHALSGEYRKALDDYEKALEINPGLASVYNDRGVTHLRYSQFERAVSDFNQAINIDPTDTLFTFNRSTAFSKSEQFEKALVDLNRVVELDKNHVDAYLHRAEIYLKQGRNGEALPDCDKAIQLDAHNPRGYMLRGTCLTEIGEIDKAIADFDKALQLNPKHFESLNRRARCYLLLKRYDEAIADLERAQAIAPDNAVLASNRGNLYEQVGQYDQAIATWEKAIQLDPTNALPYANLAALYANCLDISKRQPNRAVQLATKAVESAPNDPFNQFILGVAQYRSGNFDAAIVNLNRAVKSLATEGEHSRLFLAMSHWQRGEHEEARRWYDDAVVQLEESPTDYEDDLQRLLKEAETLLGIAPDEPSDDGRD